MFRDPLLRSGMTSALRISDMLAIGGQGPSNLSTDQIPLARALFGCETPSLAPKLLLFCADAALLKGNPPLSRSPSSWLAFR